MWILSDKAKHVWKQIHVGQYNVPRNWKTLYGDLFQFYIKMLDTLRIESKYKMRAIRCWHATTWVKLQAEARIMGYDAPLNPLQHETMKTTLRYYAKKGSDRVTEAHKRCYIKYPLAYKRLRKAIEHKN
jgi:hypothetical protein